MSQLPPYHYYVRSLLDIWPQLTSLDYFLTDPFYRTTRRGRPSPQVAVLDVIGDTLKLQNFHDAETFSSFLGHPLSASPPRRIIIVEDLSGELIEVLGSRYDIRPTFFAEHIWALNWYPRRSSPSTVPIRSPRSPDATSIRFQYVEARQVTGRAQFHGVDRTTTWDSNVLRKVSISQLASTQHQIGITRHHLSIYLTHDGTTETGSLSLSV